MEYFVGWDVGSWHCDKNPKSRDALAVLTLSAGQLVLCGNVSRCNIREQINKCNSLAGILNACCDTQISGEDSITIAIDTPLGMPISLGNLLTKGPIPDAIPQEYSENPYLYRKTEMWLFRGGHSPLSAIKDMIGSQATKGMHLIRKLGLSTSESQCGVWTSGLGNVMALETYPAPCNESQILKKLFSELHVAECSHRDKTDALCCAFVAYLYAHDRARLVPPQDDPTTFEGWIWIPVDVISERSGAAS